jgi:hypothetical protein
MRYCSLTRRRFKGVLDALPDIVVDYPTAAKSLASVLKAAIGAKLVPASVVSGSDVINDNESLRKTFAAALQ